MTNSPPPGLARTFCLCALLLAALAGAGPAGAATAREIDAKVDSALERLRSEAPAAVAVLAKAKGVLVFAEVIKAGFIFAGEGGEGALRIGGQSVAYYSIFSGSVGLQAGGQKRDIILAFMEEGALQRFRESKGWQAGVDGTVTLLDTGVSGTVDTTKLNAPIIGFIVGQRGLMAGISLDGSKITRLER